MHDWLFEVDLHSECSLNIVFLEHLLLLFVHFVIIVDRNVQWELIRVIVQIDESIVQEEACVALLPV